jgi:hypothetical protein
VQLTGNATTVRHNGDMEEPQCSPKHGLAAGMEMNSFGKGCQMLEPALLRNHHLAFAPQEGLPFLTAAVSLYQGGGDVFMVPFGQDGKNFRSVTEICTKTYFPSRNLPPFSWLWHTMCWAFFRVVPGTERQRRGSCDALRPACDGKADKHDSALHGTRACIPGAQACHPGTG